jgi:CubicO group peptidase (beta-lactamase class C family)
MLFVAALLWMDPAAAQVWPTNGWATETPAQAGMDATQLAAAMNYALTGGGSGMIARNGYLVYSWGNQKTVYDLKSATKPIGGTALGMAIGDNFFGITDYAQQYLPTIGVPPTTDTVSPQLGWLPTITLLQLSTHTAGFGFTGDFEPLLYQPGTEWSYSDCGANWLADVLTTTFDEDLNTLLFSRVFSILGITTSDLVWRPNAYRPTTILVNGVAVTRREFGSGISADVDAMGRIAYLYLRNGSWDGQQLVPASYVAAAGGPPSPLVSGLPVADPVNYPNASKHYGVLWWTNADGTLPNVPTDAYWGWGLYDSVILVIPSLGIVAARAGPINGGFNAATTWDAVYSRIAPFITPIAQSVIQVSVPAVVGLTQAAATTAITTAGLVVGTVTSQSSATVPVGSVISQSPAAGTVVTGGSAVNLVVNARPAAATPTFSPAAGTYTSAQSVTLSDTTPGAVIHYTTNGTTPTVSSAQYIAGTPLSISATTTIQAIAVASGYANSTVASGTYTVQGTTAPSGLAANASGRTVTLTWTADASATLGYDIYEGTASGTVSSTPIQQNVTGTSTVVSGLQFGQSYVFAIAAVSSTGTSPMSGSAGVTIVAAAPSGLRVSAAGTGTLNLTWAASVGAKSYSLFEGTISGGEGTAPILTGLSSTSTTVGTLTAGKQYFFTVAAVDAGGTSTPSAQASGTVVPAAPTGLVATAGNGTVSLAWSVAAGASSYSVYQGTSSSGENSLPIQTGLTSPSASVGGLHNGTLYFFYVTAVNAGGTSAVSNQANATIAPIAPSGSGGGGSMDWFGLGLLALLACTRRSSSCLCLRARSSSPPKSDAS